MDPEARSLRTIWLSDLHLGTRGSRVEELLDFLRWHDAETIYVVGDLFDGWALQRSWCWPQAHNDVVQKILRKARKGTRVVYVPGNHDEFARAYAGHHFGGVEVLLDAFHETVDGRRLWIVHGDAFDPVITKHRWLVPIALGVLSFFRKIGVRSVWGLVRRMLGRPYRSLSSFVRSKANGAMAALGDFEKLATSAARRRGADGVVCGHVHVPAMREVDGILYCNDGDWVDSCSALVEHFDGRLELLRWDPARAAAARRRTMPVAEAAGLVR